jgi:hypothetical protein
MILTLKWARLWRLFRASNHIMVSRSTRYYIVVDPLRMISIPKVRFFGWLALSVSKHIIPLNFLSCASFTWLISHILLFHTQILGGTLQGLRAANIIFRTTRTVIFRQEVLPLRRPGNNAVSSSRMILFSTKVMFLPKALSRDRTRLG